MIDMLYTEKEQGYEQKAEWHFFLGVVFFGNAGRMQQHNIWLYHFILMCYIFYEQYMNSIMHISGE